MAKNRGHGKATILSNKDYEKIYDQLVTDQQRCIFSLLRYTGERISAVLQLEVSDAYQNPWECEPRDQITYRAITRKKSDGKAITRQVPVNRAMRAELKNFQPPLTGFLFPSPLRPDASISRQSVDHWFRRACSSAGLGRQGISLHSPRRTLITKLAREGVPVAILKQVTGHQSTETLIKHYVDVDEKAVVRAMELI
ncbi:MAG: tyrosine-type recombinase/integrase [Microcoleaceae cyanobacterium]